MQVSAAMTVMGATGMSYPLIPPDKSEGLDATDQVKIDNHHEKRKRCRAGNNDMEAG
jgi:hypothetical protein